ncbi:MAG: trypsin-like peptidase domain-containing protein [Caldilineaceae bacterium]|nr:trypsin-like peptidase domain-containing protein [Caldilineaceae bacterium]
MNEASTGQNRRILWIVLGAISLIFVFSICGVIFVGGYFLINTASVSTERSVGVETAEEFVRPAVVATPVPVQPILISPDVEDYETAILSAIYEQVAPSVVNVETLSLGSSLQRDQSFLFPTPPSGTPIVPEFQIDPDSLIPRGQGSGFIWDLDGHIVTNAHVVEDADQVQIRFSDGTISVAEVVGLDEHSDLAVLRIDPAGYPLAPVARGDIDDVNVGDRVAAIGNPFGFEGTLTSGIVSAIGRSIPALTSFSIPEAIQTDAVINPGNSGGPLLNERGEVIGVNAQIRVSDLGNTGIGFAIPISIVERVVPVLIVDGVYQHSYIGISGNTYSPICSDVLGFPKTIRGAYVSSVLSGTPAARAGLRGGEEAAESNLMGVCPEMAGGDLILAIEDQPVTQFDDLLIYLERFTSPGDTVQLTILRDGEERTIDVTLAARPDRTQ